jgi:hypothetical protein
MYESTTLRAAVHLSLGGLPLATRAVRALTAQATATGLRLLSAVRLAAENSQQ